MTKLKKAGLVTAGVFAALFVIGQFQAPEVAASLVTTTTVAPTTTASRANTTTTVAAPTTTALEVTTTTTAPAAWDPDRVTIAGWNTLSDRERGEWCLAHADEPRPPVELHPMYDLVLAGEVDGTFVAYEALLYSCT